MLRKWQKAAIIAMAATLPGCVTAGSPTVNAGVIGANVTLTAFEKEINTAVVKQCAWQPTDAFLLALASSVFLPAANALVSTANQLAVDVCAGAVVLQAQQAAPAVPAPATAPAAPVASLDVPAAGYIGLASENADAWQPRVYVHGIPLDGHWVGKPKRRRRTKR